MLYELKEEIVNQPEKGVFRRIFVDDNDSLDLYVWYNKNKEIISFQLCYGSRSRAATWKPGHDLIHENINNGKGLGRWKGIMLLEPDGILDREKPAQEFIEASGNIDKEIANFVYHKLLNQLE